MTVVIKNIYITIKIFISAFLKMIFLGLQKKIFPFDMPPFIVFLAFQYSEI